MVKHHPVSPKNRTPLFVGVLTLILIVAALKWVDVVKKLADGAWVLTDERQDLRDGALDRNTNAEQYVLLAVVSGWYKCYLCPEGQYWLNEGEIAKIGITTNPMERYSEKWIQDNRVEYVREIVGDLTTVRKAEIERISTYPLTPENMTRPKEKRLIVPVFHKTYSLR
jgi:hypothetical protein